VDFFNDVTYLDQRKPMREVRDERARPLNTPQQPMGDQLPDGALHRESGHVELLAELVLGRNPILGLQIARLKLMQNLVLDLQVSRLSHCLAKSCLWRCFSGIRFTCKYKSGTLSAEP
jgi:hypothetical protein